MPRPPAATPLDPIITTLRTTRQCRGIHQGAIAYAAGVDRTSVTGWENGRVQPPLPRLRAWAAALGYSLELTTVSRVESIAAGVAFVEGTGDPPS